MDTAILFATLTAVTIPAALACRWWLRCTPGRLEDSRAAVDELQSAWRDLLVALARAWGLVWLVDRLASLMDRRNRPDV